MKFFELSRGYSRFSSYFCRASFSRINFRQLSPPSSPRLNGKNLPKNISRGTFRVVQASRQSFQVSEAEFFLHVSTFLLLLLFLFLQRRRVLFFFLFPRSHGTLGRASSRAFSASRGWFTMDDEWWKEERKREREKGKRIGDSLARVSSRSVEEKMEIFFVLFPFLFDEEIRLLLSLS